MLADKTKSVALLDLSQLQNISRSTTTPSDDDIFDVFRSKVKIDRIDFFLCLKRS